MITPGFLALVYAAVEEGRIKTVPAFDANEGDYMQDDLLGIMVCVLDTNDVPVYACLEQKQEIIEVSEYLETSSFEN